MKIDVDTSTVKELTDKIIKLSDELNDLGDKLYDNINSLFTNGYWQGISALKYQESIKDDALEYKKLCESIKDFGVILKSSNNDLEIMAKRYINYDKNIH